MKRLTTTLAAALAMTALGCAWLFDTGDYEARPQTSAGQTLHDQEANEEYLDEQSNR